MEGTEREKEIIISGKQNKAGSNNNPILILTS
jgi:hypothetical protein